MHKQRLNSARLKIVLQPRGPVLIKSGIETPDPTRPSMEFVRTHHPGHGETVYLPGSSLKGALRSHAERSLRGQRVPICATFGKKLRPGMAWNERDFACHDRPKAASGEATFAQLCAACRTFGSLHAAGRFNITDAYPWSPDESFEEQGKAHELANRTEKRFQIGINRHTGKVQSGALFDLELAVQGAFYAEIQLHNYQLWQLGLVGAMLNDLSAGDLPIGFGKSRGLGQMEASITALTVQSTSRAVDRLCGTAALLAEGTGYQLFGSPSQDQLDLTEINLPDAEVDSLSTATTWRGSRIDIRGSKTVDTLMANLCQGPLAGFLAVEGKP